jgi:hypothetical protein
MTGTGVQRHHQLLDAAGEAVERWNANLEGGLWANVFRLRNGV